MEEFKELFLLLKEYIQKQRENVTLGLIECLTKVLFIVTMGLLLILLCAMVLLLLGFAFAFWMEECTGSYIVGFSASAGVAVLISLLLWIMRRRLVLQPLARIMVRIFLQSSLPSENSTSTNSTHPSNDNSTRNSESA